MNAVLLEHAMEIRSGSLPELLAREESWRCRLTTQVDRMQQMQKSFQKEHRAHYRSNGSVRFDEHKELGDCFREVKALDRALSALHLRKEQIRAQERQALLVKPIQASGTQPQGVHKHHIIMTLSLSHNNK